MSSLKTAFHLFHKWLGGANGDNVSRTEFNENFDSIDTKLGDFALLPTTEKTNLAGAVAEHANSTSSHSATSAATANRIIVRDTNGRAKVAAPSVADDIARKAEVDAVQANVDNLSFTGSAHDALVTAALVDADGVNYGAAGAGTYLNGRLTAWEQKHNSHTAETMQYEGKKFNIINPYVGGSPLTGQMHFHTTNSDGLDTPVDAVTAYKNVGYDFAIITDHDVITPPPAVEGITLIPGSEEAGADIAQPRHITCYDVDTLMGKYNSPQDIINFHRLAGKLVSVAHPSNIGRYYMSDKEIKSYTNNNFMEIYNAIVVNTYTDDLWDVVLSICRKVWGIAVDDCHNIGNAAVFNKGYVVAFCESNTKDNILSALRDGNFYASTGNDINISLDDTIITASSAAASNFTFYGYDGMILKTENGVTSSSYTILGYEMYVRVKSELASDTTKKAFSQPIFVDCVGDDGRPISDMNNDLNPVSLCKNIIRNGRFNIAQRGTSFANPAINAITLDGWRVLYGIDGASVLPGLTHSQQPLTPADNVPGARNCYRISSDGAGSGFLANNYYAITQTFEKGVEDYCGEDKSIIVEFWARSSVAKRIGIAAKQIYGTGGSTAETLTGSYFWLNTGLERFYIEIPTNTLKDKIVAADNTLRLEIFTMWGTSLASRFRTYTKENFAACDIDIALIDVYNGKSERPFEILKPSEELLECCRYTWIPEASSYARMVSYTANSITFFVPTPVPMRVNPAVIGTVNTDLVVYNMSGAAQTGFTAAAVTAGNGVKLVLSKTAHGLTDAYLEIKPTSGFHAEP